MTLTTPTRGQSVITMLTLGTFYLYTKFGDSRFRCSGDMIAGVKINKNS